MVDVKHWDLFPTRVYQFKYEPTVRLLNYIDTIVMESEIEGLSSQSENYTPHMLNLDLLGAISFDKGCYTGQEIIARTQFLGNSKRRLMRYRIGETVAACGVAVP